MGRRLQPTRRAAAWLTAWAVLSTVGILLHWHGWVLPRMEPPVRTWLGGDGFKPLAGLFSIAAAPAWLLSTAVLGWMSAYALSVVVFVNAAAWGMWLSLLAGGLKLRRHLAGLRAAGKPGRSADSGDVGGGGGRRGASAVGESGLVTGRLSRRQLLVDGLCGGAAVGATATLGYGTVIEPSALAVARYRVQIRDLPQELDGLRAVFISDTHLGPRVQAAYLQRAVRMALDLEPDVFLLGGDYIHNGPQQVQPAVDLLAPLLARPCLGVLGNHDWMANDPPPTGRLERPMAPRGASMMGRAMEAAGFVMVDNTRAFLRRSAGGSGVEVLAGEPDGACLCVAGVGDLQQHIADPGSALRGVRGGTPRLLLSHWPDVAAHPGLIDPGTQRGRPGARVDLMLSGHTHGGQVRLPLLGTPIVPSGWGARHGARGLIDWPAFPVLISAGVGVSLIPLRINVPPELVEITLVRKPA